MPRIVDILRRDSVSDLIKFRNITLTVCSAYLSTACYSYSIQNLGSRLVLFSTRILVLPRFWALSSNSFLWA